LCIRKDSSPDLINRRDRKTFPLSSPDEPSEGLTGGVGRCNVRRIRYPLKQAKAKNFDLSRTDGAKPTGEGTSIDRMDKIRKFWNRHRVSPVSEMLLQFAEAIVLNVIFTHRVQEGASL
jgi:hypothetical protein